jgi:hypothetical protein
VQRHQRAQLQRSLDQLFVNQQLRDRATVNGRVLTSLEDSLAAEFDMRKVLAFGMHVEARGR